MRNKNCILLYMIMLIVKIVVCQLTKESLESLKRKDVFRIDYCPKEFTVLENMPGGTTVGRVLASNPVGTVTYSTLEIPDEIPFQINNKTGIITTKEIFDRDEPANQVKFSITVEAKQNGEPPMHAYCRVEITILDSNDNPPIFIKKVYSETVRQEVKMGEKVMQISAIDIDDGENAIVTYRISSLHGDDISFFRIHSMTGEIFWAENIHKPAGYIFRLLVVATDKGVSPRSTSIPIEILVVKSSSKHPSFNMQSPISINLAEDFNPFQLTAFTFEVRSNIEGDPFVSCGLMIGTIEQTNRDHLFNLKMSTNLEGSIQVWEPFDYERIRKYSLILRATNRDNLTSEMEITVNIQNVNDNPPVLQRFSPITIVEGMKAGFPLVKVYATDADKSISNGHNKYQLGSFEDLIAIDRSTGLLMTLKKIGRNESQLSWIRFKVIVYDDSRDIVYSSEQVKTECIYQINITPDSSLLIDDPK